MQQFSANDVWLVMCILTRRMIFRVQKIYKAYDIVWHVKSEGLSTNIDVLSGNKICDILCIVLSGYNSCCVKAYSWKKILLFEDVKKKAEYLRV